MRGSRVQGVSSEISEFKEEGEERRTSVKRG